MSWKRLDAATERGDWAKLLRTAVDASLWQSYGWGEYRRAFGWVPERWVARDGNGKPVCCLQALNKRLPLNRVVAWVPGGPMFGFPGTVPGAAGELVSGWLDEARRGTPLVYARFHVNRRHCPGAAYSLSQTCRRPVFKINSGFTVQVDLAPSLDELRSGMTAKHRYYAKQAEAAGLGWKFGNTGELARDTALVHREMVRKKGLTDLRCDGATLSAIDRGFGDGALFLLGYRNGSPVTACLVLIEGDVALYLLAATSPEGRTTSAAYAMIVQLFEILKSRGITRFDFGGLAPRSPAAAGVDHFKRGFGGQVVEYLGEWEWAAAESVRWAANFLVKWRGGI